MEISSCNQPSHEVLAFRWGLGDQSHPIIDIIDPLSQLIRSLPGRHVPLISHGVC